MKDDSGHLGSSFRTQLDPMVSLLCAKLGPLSMAFLLQSQGRRAKRSTEIRVLDYGVTFLNNKDEG